MWKHVGAPRDRALQHFLDLTEACVTAATRSSEAHVAGRKVFSALRLRPGRTGDARPQRLPVCAHFDTALAEAKSSASGIAALAASLAAIEPRFAWQRRRGADPGNQPFYGGHANAMIVGPGGLEDHGDVWIGTTLMARGITYVDHDHPPEEIYLALTPGQWWNEDMDWTDPGLGGLIYNRPGVRHAMRSGEVPFLALWLLPVDDPSARPEPLKG